MQYNISKEIFMPYALVEKEYNTLTADQQQIIYSIITSFIRMNAKTHIQKPSGHAKFGVALGKYHYPDDINLYDDEIAELFGCN